MDRKFYHVALSYAGEQRPYIAEVAQYLSDRNVRCFYDKDEEINLWGKSIPNVLKDIYAGGQAHFVVIFISEDYVKKAFPKTELKHALSHAIIQNQEYILPARFDSTDVPGLPFTDIYINLSDMKPVTFAEKIIQKMTAMGIYFGPDTQGITEKWPEVPKKNEAQVTFTIKGESGDLISEADIYLIHQNKTHRRTQSNQNGEAVFPLVHPNKSFYTIFIAHNDFPACIIDNFRCNKDLNIELRKNNDIGSMILNGTGYIPGIEGRLNPILDQSNRTYLYANNISINNGSLQQPIYFQFKENISIVDCSGKTADIRIHRIIQKCTVLDYITHGE